MKKPAQTHTKPSECRVGRLFVNANVIVVRYNNNYVYRQLSGRGRIRSCDGWYYIYIYIVVTIIITYIVVCASTYELIIMAGRTTTSINYPRRLGQRGFGFRSRKQRNVVTDTIYLHERTKRNVYTRPRFFFTRSKHERNASRSVYRFDSLRGGEKDDGI